MQQSESMQRVDALVWQLLLVCVALWTLAACRWRCWFWMFLAYCFCLSVEEKRREREKEKRKELAKVTKDKQTKKIVKKSSFEGK